MGIHDFTNNDTCMQAEFHAETEGDNSILDSFQRAGIWETFFFSIMIALKQTAGF
jgi:hypothetical protein